VVGDTAGGTSDSTNSASGAGHIDHAPDGQGGGQTAGIQTMLDTRR